jgi:hypothetical protein
MRPYEGNARLRVVSVGPPKRYKRYKRYKSLSSPWHAQPESSRQDQQDQQDQQVRGPRPGRPETGAVPGLALGWGGVGTGLERANPRPQLDCCRPPDRLGELGQLT